LSYLLLLAISSVNSTTSTTVAGAIQGKPVWLVAAEVVVALAAIAVVGTLFTRLVRSIAVRAGASKAVASSITQWMGVLMLLAGVGAVTTLTGLSSELTTLTVSGIFGLAVSLALQSTLSNVISGVLMIHDGFLRLGDDIQYGGPGGVRGEIVKLSLRTTWIRSQEGIIAVIGNSNLSAGPILNYSAKARLQKKLEV
jgi:small conductance mechanosensitive channel